MSAAATACRSYNPVGDDGKFIASTPLFAGMSVWEANPKVIETLALEGCAAAAHTKIQHSYPHCWRHKTPIIFRATTQWFVRMDGEHKVSLRGTALQAIEDTQFFPSWGKARLNAMIANRPDWVRLTSAQLGRADSLSSSTKETGEPHPRTPELIEEVAKCVEQGRHRGLVRARSQGTAGRRSRPLHQDERHARRLGSIRAPRIRA